MGLEVPSLGIGCGRDRDIDAAQDVVVSGHRKAHHVLTGRPSYRGLPRDLLQGL